MAEEDAKHLLGLFYTARVWRQVPDMRRAVITGIGVVSPLGSDLRSFWERIKGGYSGIRRIRKFDASAYASQIAGEVIEYDVNSFVPPKEQRRMDEFSRYAVGAAKMAITDSGIDTNSEASERIGVIMGSGIGGLQTLELQHSQSRRNLARRQIRSRTDLVHRHRFICCCREYCSLGLGEITR